MRLADCDLIREDERREARQAWVLPDVVAKLFDVVREHAELEASVERSHKPVHWFALAYGAEEGRLEAIETGPRLGGCTEALVEAFHVEGAGLELRHESEVARFEVLAGDADPF